MNKAGLVSQIAAKTQLTRRDIEMVLNAMMESVTESLEEGEKVQLAGFGTFEVRLRKPRKGLNPGTKEIVDIPERRLPTFRPGKGLIDAVK